MATHAPKDYAMESWIQNVAQVQLEYLYDFLIVDNSPSPDYAKQLNNYCQKYKVKNYIIRYISLPPEQEKFERIARSREVIREYLLAHNYDAWFSWESDILIPVNALEKLINIVNSGDYLFVAHNNWTRQISDMPNFDWGLALVRREALEKYSFILNFGTDPEMPETYEPSEAWFRKRVLRDGGKFIEVDGVFAVKHLNNEG